VSGSIKQLFVGPDGLRHGWRFLLFAIGIEIGLFAIELPLGRLLGQLFGINLGELSAPALSIAKFATCVSVFVVTGIFSVVERRCVDSYGLPIDEAFRKSFWKGMLAGLIAIVFLAGAMMATGGMVVHGLALNGTDLVKFFLLWFVANILIGVGEEYTFRGYALQSLWRGAGFWPAALITTAVFAGDHLEKPGENFMDIAMIFLAGLIMAISVLKTGSLWWAVGWHAAFDFGQLFLIGTQNGGVTPIGRLFDVTFPGPAWINGGDRGTEASIFMVPAIIGTLIYVLWFLRNGKAKERQL
jgi:membrane protease YdiL (CAAX protease family)